MDTLWNLDLLHPATQDSPFYNMPNTDEGWILTRLGETMDGLCESTVWGIASAVDRQILAGAMPVSSATPSIPVFPSYVI